MKKKNNIVKNATWLYVFQITKIIFPFLTLPYLTRVLSTDTYGTVTYVKTVMTYMQILVDFGFVLSGTKEIVSALKKNNHDEVNDITSDTLIARIILGIIGYITIIVLSFILPIVKENFLFTMLSYTVVFESIFLFDFLFRGYEKMHIISLRFILMKTISVLLTFLLVKNDSDIMLIPILDIIASLIAILLVMFEIKKLDIKFRYNGIKNSLKKIGSSFIYFLSNAASTSFNAFSTIVIGIYLSKTDIAYWGICMQLIGTIQALYTPLAESIYPEMIKTKKISIVNKLLKIFTPIVIVGCLVAYFLAPLVMHILGGAKYEPAVLIFRILIPCLILGFYAIIYGWSVLGSIGKEKEVTISTVASIIVNIIGLFLLVFINKFTLVNIAILRVITELSLFLIRFSFYFVNRKKFN